MFQVTIFSIRDALRKAHAKIKDGSDFERPLFRQCLKDIKELLAQEEPKPQVNLGNLLMGVMQNVIKTEKENDNGERIRLDDSGERVEDHGQGNGGEGERGNVIQRKPGRPPKSAR